MRRLPLLILSVIFWMLNIGAPSAAQGVTPLSSTPAYSQMAQKAAGQGSIRVIVQLDVPEIQSYAAASAQFKAGRANALAMVQAAVADGALTAQIADTADNMLNHMVASDYEVLRRYNTFPLVALEVSPEALDALAKDPQVIQITEDRLMRPFLDNTTNIIGASNSWTSGYSGTGWFVAIVDSGIRRTHDFFSGKDIVEACFSAINHCPNNGGTMTGTGAAAHHPSTYWGWDHGTHVAGIAAGNNGSSLYGVARDADIIAVQVFSRFDDDPLCGVDPDDDCVLAYNSDIIAGLEHVYSLRTTHNIAAVNLSLGGGAEDSACDTDPMKPAIDLLHSAGIATVVASGNSGVCTGISSPACISTAISVGATTDADTMAGFSNYQETLLDLFAPGVSIVSSIGDSDTSYGNKGGTSMAAPHVAGAFALLRQANDTSSVTQLLDNLKTNGVAATGSTNCGTGGDTLPVPRIQVDAAISPIAPDGLAATAADSDQVDLVWNDNANNEQGFKIERKTGAAGTYSQIDTAAADDVSYSDTTTLTEGTDYYYRIRAYNGADDSAFSSEVNASTLLASPSGLTATVISDTQIDLVWTDISLVETSYEIQRRTGSGSFAPLTTVSANAVSYSDTTLSPGITYHYQIRGSNGTLFSLYVQTSARTTGGGGGGGSGGGCFLSTMVVQ